MLISIINNTAHILNEIVSCKNNPNSPRQEQSAMIAQKRKGINCILLWNINKSLNCTGYILIFTLKLLYS